MKKNIGSLLALYPLPVTVIGAMNGANPTWTLVAHVGIIGHDKVLVSLAKPHFINSIIKETKKLTINLVQPDADLAGSLSGSKEDKSQLFAWLTQDGKSPIIEKSPLTMVCSVVDIYETDGFESFICTIDGTYVEKGCMTETGKPDYNKLKPVLFQFPSYEYLATGKCLSFKSKKEEK